MTEAWNASHARIPHHEPSLSNILLARRTFPPRSITPRTLSNSIPFAGKEGSYIFCMRARVEVVVFSLLLIAIVNLKLSIHALRKSDIGFLHKVNTGGQITRGTTVTSEKNKHFTLLHTIHYTLHYYTTYTTTLLHYCTITYCTLSTLHFTLHTLHYTFNITQKTGYAPQSKSHSRYTSQSRPCQHRKCSTRMRPEREKRNWKR
jgi:hypothetical protein